MYRIYNDDTEEVIEYTNLLSYLLDLIPNHIKLSVWIIVIGFMVWLYTKNKCNWR